MKCLETKTTIIKTKRAEILKTANQKTAAREIAQAQTVQATTINRQLRNKKRRFGASFLFYGKGSQ
ncbi:MAG: hypothetical protein FWG91_04770 [Lachnospiraceae bacterium]|nr:hypothetical protein [Lachnospiraceae bacterium]